jgi:tetratricopeptide (TPR) repeat protein
VPVREENREEWWRCAYFAYLDSDIAHDRADQVQARQAAIASLQDTLAGFLDGGLNFGTLKYRMDAATAESGGAFPPPSVSSTLSDLGVGVPLYDLERGLRGAARLPDGPGGAKGALMDLEDLLERAINDGYLDRSKARPERWADLLACLWQVQDGSWPLWCPPAVRSLQARGELDASADYGEYATVMLRLADWTGGTMADLEDLLTALDAPELEVPDPETCFRENLQAAEEHAAEGRNRQALERYERALALRPRTARALRAKADLYVAEGLTMAAIGELELLVELEPSDREAHAKLVALYRSRNMVREHNIEVRRWKAQKAR